MQEDHLHIMDTIPHLFAPARRGNAAKQSPTNSGPSFRDLLSRNIELTRQNRQLTVALARLTADRTRAMVSLTPRQQEVMSQVLAGHPSKNIAADLHISQRTVENHRAAIMRRTGAASLPALVRMSLGVS